MKGKMLFITGICLLMFSCHCEEKRSDNIQITESVNFEKDWANVDLVKVLTFPINLFPDISNEYEQKIISYYQYGFDNYNGMNAGTAIYAKLLLIRSFNTAIFCEIYKVDSLNFCRIKINNKNDGSFGEVIFDKKQEIHDSVFNNFFNIVNGVDYWDMCIEPENEEIDDGSVWFFDIKDSSKHKYIVRYSPTYYPKGRIRANEKELKDVENLGMYLLDILGVEHLIGPMY